MSVTSNDWTQRVYTKHDIDSLAGTALAFDPARYIQFIHVNQATVPLNVDKWPNVAYSAALGMNEYGNNILVEYSHTGPSYYAFGNPYMVRDRKGVQASDKITMLKRKISLTVRYQSYINNMTGYVFSTVKTSQYGGQLSIAPGKKLPSINFSGMMISRSSPSIDSLEIKGVNDELLNLLAAINYTLKTGKLMHGIFITASTNQRTDHAHLNNGTTTTFWMAGLNEMWNDKISLSLNANSNFTSSEVFGTINSQMIYGVQAGYRFSKKHPVSIRPGFRLSTTAKTDFSLASSRSNLDLTITYQPIKPLVLSMMGGFGQFSMTGNPNAQYSEPFVSMRITYRIDTVKKKK